MRLLSHRGLWSSSLERNSLEAFVRSFEAGFGAEVDVRDDRGELVVSHDPPVAGALPLGAVLESHRRIDQELPLAFNVKSCGVAGALARMLAEFGVENYFVFDMAVPDALDYVRRRMPAFTRVSEHEAEPSFYPLAAGVWLDCFERDWIDTRVVAAHLEAGKDVALVSPELHGRPHAETWRRWTEITNLSSPGLYLCTDHPEEARALFGATAGG